MYPVIFQIGPFALHSYGFLLAVGFLVSVYFVKKLSRESGLDPQKMVDLMFWQLLFGFIGGRILFVFTRLEYFLGDPLAIFRIWEGGLVYYGGMILATVFSYFYLKKHRLPFFKVADVMIGFLWMHIIGRWGCFAAGCCYGKPTDLPWGVSFNSDLVDDVLRGVPLHPVQLYESFSLMILFYGLLWIFRHRKFEGQALLTYFIVYPILRSILEIFRGDRVRGFVFGEVSTSQFISILIFIVASTVFVVRTKEKRT